MNKSSALATSDIYDTPEGWCVDTKVLAGWLNVEVKADLSNALLIICIGLIWALAIWMLSREFGLTESSVPATWFGVLNSFFLVILAPMFSKMWEKHWNPSGPIKFGVGLVLLGLGFAALSYGAAGIPAGAKTAQVSMMYLTVAYLLHTMGELCLSPIGLSLMTTLAPKPLHGMMMGMWFLASAYGQYAAGILGAAMSDVGENATQMQKLMAYTDGYKNLAIYALIAGAALIIISPLVRKLMHDVH